MALASREGFAELDALLSKHLRPLIKGLFAEAPDIIALTVAGRRWESVIRYCKSITGLDEFLAREVTADWFVPVDSLSYQPLGPGFRRCCRRIVQVIEDIGGENNASVDALADALQDDAGVRIPPAKRQRGNDKDLALLFAIHKRALDGGWATACKTFGLQPDRQLEPLNVETLGCMCDRYFRARINAVASFNGGIATEIPYSRRPVADRKW